MKFVSAGRELEWSRNGELTVDGRLWRLAPWPVDEALFDVPMPEAAAGSAGGGASAPRRASAGTGGSAGRHASGRVLAAEGDADSRDAALTALADRGIDATAAEELSDEAIRDAAVVVLIGDGRLPAAGMAPLAAGRLLVAVECATSFGLVPGVDHLAADSAEAAAALVDVALDQWEALAPMRVLGRRAAERHRAPAVYSRLEEDLAIESSSAASSGTDG